MNKEERFAFSERIFTEVSEKCELESEIFTVFCTCLTAALLMVCECDMEEIGPFMNKVAKSVAHFIGENSKASNE